MTLKNICHWLIDNRRIAVELARNFQPARTMTQLNPLTMREEQIKVPSFDLTKFIQTQESSERKRERGQAS